MCKNISGLFKNVIYQKCLQIIHICTGWNDKIVALEKFILFHFRFLFLSFFVFADHLLVDQLCTNPKSDRSLLSCLNVTQCSTSEIRDAPLYNSCFLPIQIMTTGPLPAPSKCKSGLPRITGTCPGWWKQSSSYGYGLWCGFKWGPHHAISHLRSRLESQHQRIPGCAEECGDLLVQSGGRWQTLGVAAGLGAEPQAQRDPGFASEGVLRLCTLLSLVPLLPWPEPAWLLRLVIGREHHRHDLQQHRSQPDRRHPPSILRAPAGACRKGMLPVQDPYRDGDWGRRRLHWIDFRSTKLSELIFSIKVLK